MNRTRAFESFVCIAVLVAVLFVGVWQIRPAEATTIFSDGFESGDFSAWTALEGEPEVVTTYAHHGSYSCKIDDQEGPYKDLGASYSALWMRVYVYFTALPTSEGYLVGIIRIGNPTHWDYAIYAEAYKTNDGTYFSLFHGYYSERVNTDVVVETGKWYCVEVKFSSVSDVDCELWIDGVQKATAGYYLGGDASRVSVGYGSAMSGLAVCYIDCVVVVDTPEVSNYALTINSTPISVPYLINGTETGYSVNATSGSPSDIQTAINNVASNGGGTVYVPAGNFSFDYSGSSGVTVYGGVNVIGQGINSTILRETYDPPTDSMMFYLDGSNGKPIRISGIFFKGYVKTTEDYSPQAIEIDAVKDFRIDHCRFEDFSGHAVGAGGKHRGVVDHCNFANPYKQYLDSSWAYGIICWGDEETWNNIDWYLGQYDGRYNIMYVEDCTFQDTRHAIAGNGGGFYIVRHCTFTDPDPYNFGQLDVHGGGGALISGRGLEAYDNLIVGQTGYDSSQAFWIRGGGGVIFNNTMENEGYGVGLFKDNENSTYWVKDLYIWGNTMDRGTLINNYSGYTENVDFFLSAKSGYAPYSYPHPLTLDSTGTTNDTVSFAEGTYLVTVPAQTTSGGNTYNFSQWQDSSTNTTITVSLTANTTITATYTVYVTDTSGTVGVVGVTGTYGYAAVEYAVQRKTFYANGRFWVFYFNGTLSANSTVYATSTDGLSWSSSVNMTNRTCGAGWRFAVTFNGTILSYAFSTSTNGDPLYYRAGTPNSDGTITWLDSEQNVTVGENLVSHLWPSIAIDSAGYPWIAYARKNATENSRYAYITTSSWTNGTWNTASGFPYKFSPYNYTGINTLVVPLTNQKVLAVGSNAGQHVMAYRWNGSSWGAEANTTSIIIDSGTIEISLSAVNQGDDVHLAFIKNGTRNLVHTKYAYASNSWGTETTIQSAVNETSSPVLSIDTSTNDLYCFWAGSPEANAIYYKRYNGTNWVFASDSNPWITETALAGYYKYDGLSGFYQTYDHKIGLAYTNGTTVYYVKFKYLNITAPEVTVIVTYPANTTYSTPTISVQLSASGGIIDTIWWNCKNGTSWIYGTNQTYTAPTSMTEFVNGASYTFYAWANNTDGDWDEETVMFTVLILYPDFGSWWGDWWGIP
jgi:hypothetical protein